MTDDAAPVAAAPPAPSPAAGPPTPDVVGYSQLTQLRVPLDDAGEAFSVPDANGRLPIVVLPKQPFRIQNAFVAARVEHQCRGLHLSSQVAHIHLVHFVFQAHGVLG